MRRVRSALVFPILLLAGCGAVVRPIARVDRFGPWDQPRGTLCANGRPLSVDLRQPPACGPGEEAWEQRFPNGGLLRECRTAERVTARQAISLSTTGCIEEVERWRSVDGRVVSDAVRSWARWTEHVEVDVPCPRTGVCFVGPYRVAFAGGPSVSGAFDDLGRVHGVWRFDDQKDHHEIEFVHGAGQVRAWGPLVKLDCVDGLVDGELIVHRPAAEGRVVELRATVERGLRHGPFRVGVVDGASMLEGRYEQGSPVGAWTLPTSTCIEQHLGSQCGFMQCVRWAQGTTAGVCEGDCRATPGPDRDLAPTPPGPTSLATTPKARLAPLTCHEVLTSVVPVPGRMTPERFTAHHATDAFAELGALP